MNRTEFQQLAPCDRRRVIELLQRLARLVEAGAAAKDVPPAAAEVGAGGSAGAAFCFEASSSSRAADPGN